MDATPIVVAHDEVLQHKQLYLNMPFFLVRAAIYFLVWNALSYFLNAWSLEQDRTGDPRLARRMQMLSAGGLRRLRPDDHLRVVRLADVARAALVLDDLRRADHGRPGAVGAGVPDRRARRGSAAARRSIASSSPAHFHDLGNLMLAFVMLWAYFSFSQYLIIWSGNLPAGDRLVPAPAADRLARRRRWR